MEQRTHAWIAVRAVALLEEKGSNKKLVELLRPCARHAAIGAWLPDLADMRRSGGGIQHHVLKLQLYKGGAPERFVAERDQLLGRLACSPAAREYLGSESSLDGTWWSTAYRADPAPGQHIANRAMALSSVLKDLLLMGAPSIDDLLPGRVKFIDSVDDDARTTQEEAALFFFMLSHFIADACMPCHSDARPLAGYDEGLHKELEAHWRKGIPTAFNDAALSKTRTTGKAQDEVLAAAREVDAAFALQFDSVDVPELPKGRDVWLEIIDACRASFAMSSIIAPPSEYRFDDESARAPFAEVLGGGRQPVLEAVDRVALTDAVVNTAAIWSHVWRGVAREE